MIKTAFVSFMLVLLSSLTFAQEDPSGQSAPMISIGEQFSVPSEILDEDRAYWVYLPASYDSENSSPQSYPVMYVLDGSSHFQSATGVVQFMSSGINGNRQIPEMIVVAIPNTDRPRDLTPTRAEVGYNGEPSEFLAGTGGGDAFLQFINDELFPKIDSTYRTLPHRTRTQETGTRCHRTPEAATPSLSESSADEWQLLAPQAPSPLGRLWSRTPSTRSTASRRSSRSESNW